MNYAKKSNPHYSVEIHRFEVVLPSNKAEITKDYLVENVLKDINQEKKYTKHYFPQENTMKVFLKGGSMLSVDLTTKQAIFEELKPRYIVGSMAKLHYNPNKAWTWFSNIFAVCLMIIIITGLIMVKGKKGLIGRGGIELLIGLIIPFLFLL